MSRFLLGNDSLKIQFILREERIHDGYNLWVVGDMFLLDLLCEQELLLQVVQG